MSLFQRRTQSVTQQIKQKKFQEIIALLIISHASIPVKIISVLFVFVITVLPNIFYDSTLSAQTAKEKSKRTKTLSDNVDKKSTSKNESEQKENTTVWMEYELNAYYSNVGLYMSLTGKEPDDIGSKEELDVYKHLISKSFLPTFLVFEVSAYPMPILGVSLKSYENNFYNSAKVSDNFNLIESVTAGFQEPYAVSLFLGNVVVFSEPGQERKKGNLGMMGFLTSYGSHHIVKNTLVEDNWVEFEWKGIGKRRLVDYILKWSYRIGTRYHENSNISSIAYIGLKRHRADLGGPFLSFLHNSGFEYVIDYDYSRNQIIRHYFVIDKKYPVKEKVAFGLSIGFIWESASKYHGDLENISDAENWKFVIRPNLNF